MSTSSNLDRLQALRDRALAGGGPEHAELQHAHGRLTACERLELLLDKGSFRETDLFVTQRTSNGNGSGADGSPESVITGWGTIDGRLVYVFSQDFTVIGGSLGEAHAEKICKIMDMALKNGAPLIGLNNWVGPASRKASSPSAGTRTSSCATRLLRASSHRSAPSWGLAPVGPYIPPP